MLRKKITVGKLEFRLNWVVAACVISVVGGLARLGIWQLERAEEKIALQDSYREMRKMAPSAIEHVPLAGREYDAIQLQNRRVTVHGEYLNDKSLFLIYQSYEEQIGFEIMTPVKLVERDEIVLVSRGWTGAATYEALKQSLPAIDGVRELQGQIYVPREAEAARKNNIETVKWPLLLRHMNTDELQPLFSSPLFPYVVRLNEGQSGVLVRHWPEVQVDAGRNFSYALQWFSMAIAVAVVSLILSSNILTLLGVKAK
ncbi:MAG: SURF1 family protein [Cellvibrionaceae bacterium]